MMEEDNNGIDPQTPAAKSEAEKSPGSVEEINTTRQGADEAAPNKSPRAQEDAIMDHQDAEDQELKQKSKRVLAWTQRSDANPSEKSLSQNNVVATNLESPINNCGDDANGYTISSNSSNSNNNPSPQAPTEGQLRISDDCLKTATLTSPQRLQMEDTSIPGAFPVDGPNISVTSAQIEDNNNTDTIHDYSNHPHENSQPHTDVLVSAVTVSTYAKDEQDLENQIREKVRQEILDSATEADVVSLAGEPKSKTRTKVIYLGILLATIVLSGTVGLVVGMLERKERESKNASLYQSTPAPSPSSFITGPTLQAVRDRGHVRCGTYDESDGFAFTNKDTGLREGINVDQVCSVLYSLAMVYLATNFSLLHFPSISYTVLLFDVWISQCRAIALLALGDISLHREVYINSRSRFDALQNNTADVIITRTTYTMGRDVFEPSQEVGFTFSTPYLYSGIAFVGVPEYVDCVDELETFVGICRQLKICVATGTTHETILDNLLAASYIIRTKEGLSEFIDHLDNGTCNVFVQDAAGLSEVNDGSLDDYKIGSRVFLSEPLALVTRDNDSEWSRLVDNVVQFAFAAEGLNLTQRDARLLLEEGTSENRSKAYDQMVLLTAELGNYDEMYQRNLKTIFPREGPNLLYDTSVDKSGLLYYMPFGDIDIRGPGAKSGRTLERVMERGHLICALGSNNDLARYSNVTKTWNGMAVEFCKALSAALFLGQNQTIIFVDIRAHDDAGASTALINGTVDIISGISLTLEKQSTQNIAFSAPWYYDNLGNAFGMATGPDDSTWQDFVYWVVMASMYAEDQNITSANPLAMPLVSLFGEDFKAMFLDSISAAGSYSEIHESSRQSGAPRSAYNFLNQNLEGPQQFPLPFS